MQPITILIADDDMADCKLAKKALDASHPGLDLRFVQDGEQLMDYLRRQGRYSGPGAAPTPTVVLLDLSMPRKDGREALREIKSDPALRKIPVVVLTTSADDGDIFRCYDLGANSYITKPRQFAGLVEVMRSIAEYWCKVVSVPSFAPG